MKVGFFKNENISLYFMKVHIYIGLRVTGFTGYRFSGFFSLEFSVGSFGSVV